MWLGRWVTDAIKAVNTRLDQQAETNRKAFADQKLVIDNLTNDVRVIREKLDDNNVRIGSLTQELDSLRQSMQQMSVRPFGTSEPDASAVPGTQPSAGGQPPVVGVSPQNPDEFLQKAMIVGSPASIVEQVEAFASSGVQHMSLLFNFGFMTPEQSGLSLDLFIDEVLPRFAAVAQAPA